VSVGHFQAQWPGRQPSPEGNPTKPASRCAFVARQPGLRSRLLSFLPRLVSRLLPWAVAAVLQRLCSVFSPDASRGSWRSARRGVGKLPGHPSSGGAEQAPACAAARWRHAHAGPGLRGCASLCRPCQHTLWIYQTSARRGDLATPRRRCPCPPHLSISGEFLSRELGA